MANPNPSRITDEVWRFRTACLALEPGSNDEDSGIYANKPGYHNTRAQNDPGNYSVRDAPDQKGPSDKAAAWDWTFTTAQNGDYSRISTYGKRMLVAFNEEDDRCNVLREFLGQTDMDSTPEGLDFRYHTKRTPDDTHKWHIHWSFVRAYVAVAGALDCVLSILRGESLADYLARGGKLYKADGTGEYGMADYTEAQMRAFPWQYAGNGMPGVPVGKSTLWVLGTVYSTVMLLAERSNDITAEELAAIKAAAEAGTMAAVDDIVAAVVAALPEGTTLTQADVEAAMRSVFADAATP
jgi:hypothetical protein